MRKKDHVRAESYELSRSTPAAGGYLARLIHEHRLALCPECLAEWDKLAGLRGEYLARLGGLHARPAPPSEIPADELSGSRTSRQRQEETVAELTSHLLAAKQDFWELGRTPHDQWRRKVRHARCRFRSRPLAELLIEKCRKTVRADPEAARKLAELVPLVLDWTRGAGGPSWAPALLARAEAYRANALRVAGELQEAAAVFIDLRRRIGRRPLGDARVLGEIASLEASLCTAQRRFDETEEFLERAAMFFEAVGDRVGVARVRIKQGNLGQSLQRPEAAIWAHSEAAEILISLDKPQDLYLFICTVNGRANALCDLGRHAEAADLLAAHLDDYEGCEEPHVAATLRCLQARVDLGFERWAAAAESFADAGAAMAALGRLYDAAIMILYEAEAHHGAGRLDELRRLAGPLVEVFRAKGVAGEASKALHLFRDAVVGQRLSASLLAELRQRLDRSRPAALPPG